MNIFPKWSRAHIVMLFKFCRSSSFVFTVNGFTQKGRKSDSKRQLTDSRIIKEDTENIQL